MRTPRFFAVLVPIVVVAACDKSPGDSAGEPASSASPPPSAAAPAAPTATQAPLAAPDDLEVGALQKALKCAADAKSGPCAVLAAFGSCVPWDAVTPSGDGRWLGKGYRVENGKARDEVTIVRSRRVPLNEVGPGQLPAKFGIADIVKEDGSAFTQADKAIRALARSDVAPRSNPAIEHLKKRESWPEGFTMKTAGGQVYVAAEGGTFVCQGPKQVLYLVQRAATRGGQGDGLYAELYAVTW